MMDKLRHRRRRRRRCRLRRCRLTSLLPRAVLARVRSEAEVRLGGEDEGAPVHERGRRMR